MSTSSSDGVWHGREEDDSWFAADDDDDEEEVVLRHNVIIGEDDDDEDESGSRRRFTAYMTDTPEDCDSESTEESDDDRDDDSDSDLEHLSEQLETTSSESETLSPRRVIRAMSRRLSPSRRRRAARGSIAQPRRPSQNGVRTVDHDDVNFGEDDDYSTDSSIAEDGTASRARGAAPDLAGDANRRQPAATSDPQDDLHVLRLPVAYTHSTPPAYSAGGNRVTEELQAVLDLFGGVGAAEPAHLESIFATFITREHGSPD
jgi:hypothetical protein